MSFDWNLSSDEEKEFDDWTNDGWNDSLAVTSSTSTVAVSSDRHSDDDESSSDEESAPPSSQYKYAGIPFSSDFGDGEEEDDDDDDDDSVDWEDASQKALPSLSHKTPELASDTDTHCQTYNNIGALNLQPVTFDWTNESQTKTKTKNEPKRISRKRYRFEHLTPDLQYLLLNMERAHILSLTAHAMYASSQCSEEVSLHLAHSMIPLAWTRAPPSAPTLQELRSFSNFFFHLVHTNRCTTMATMATRMPRYRRRKSKSQKTDSSKDNNDLMVERKAVIEYRIVDYCASLAEQPIHASEQNLPKHQNFNEHDQVQLFVAMARSLGWRVRFVMALDPCKKDLDVNHPLFVAMSAKNIFQRLWKQSGRKQRYVTRDEDEQKQPAKKFKKNHDLSNSALVETNPFLETLMNAKLSSGENKSIVQNSVVTQQDSLLCWVEILCQASNTSKKRNGPDSKLTWVHLDPWRELVNTPAAVEIALYSKQEGIPFSKGKKKRPIPYAVAAEHLFASDGTTKLRLVDVTPRYASSFVETLKARGVVRGKQGPMKESDRTDMWWVATLKSVNAASHYHRQQKFQNTGKTPTEAIDMDYDENNDNDDDDDDDNDRKPAAVDHNIHEVDEHEEKLLQESRQNEPIPTSKTGFKTNPIYTLPSLLNSNEVLKPDAKKRICGVFKGEFVYRRSDVETALAANRWLYRGRKVIDSELNKPIKRVKARNKGVSKSFKALKSYGVGQANDGSEDTREKIIENASKPLDDGMENLYASWQTNPWSPSPVGPSDPIPTNEHNNIELALLNPGLVHIDEHHISKVAKHLSIPYAPCLLGFEGRRGNRTPTIRGIVVHQHNEEILREAHAEMASHFLQEEHENRQNAILLRWKRLLVGVLTKERLDRAYG